MRKISVLLFALPALITACNNQQASKETTAASDTTASAIDYAYKIDKPDNWEKGDPQNAAMVMKSLKAYQDGNIDECIQYFADSVRLEFDYYIATMPHDSLKAEFTRDRANIASMDINMEDWESVISKDKKDQWVSMWYKQKWTDKNGKTDSIYVMDDAKVVNGKIAVLDEKTRHYPKK